MSPRLAPAVPRAATRDAAASRGRSSAAARRSACVRLVRSLDAGPRPLRCCPHALLSQILARRSAFCPLRMLPGMEMRKIGSLEVSLVGVGCNNFGMRIDENRSAAVVHAALDAGINLFDTADVYGGTRSEQFLGRALGSRRDVGVVAKMLFEAIDCDRNQDCDGARWSV